MHSYVPNHISRRTNHDRKQWRHKFILTSILDPLEGWKGSVEKGFHFQPSMNQAHSELFNRRFDGGVHGKDNWHTDLKNSTDAPKRALHRKIIQTAAVTCGNIELLGTSFSSSSRLCRNFRSTTCSEYELQTSYVSKPNMLYRLKAQYGSPLLWTTASNAPEWHGFLLGSSFLGCKDQECIIWTNRIHK